MLPHHGCQPTRTDGATLPRPGTTHGGVCGAPGTLAVGLPATLRNATAQSSRRLAAGGFRQWVHVVRDRVLQTMACTEIPYEILQQELRDRGVAIVELRVFLHIGRSRPQGPRSLDMATVPLRGTETCTAMPWGFSLHVHEEDGGSNCWASFDAGLYDPAGVRRIPGSPGRNNVVTVGINFRSTPAIGHKTSWTQSASRSECSSSFPQRRKPYV